MYGVKKPTAKYYLIRAFSDHMRSREVCGPDGEQFRLDFFLLWCHTTYLSVTISYFIRCRK